MAHVLIIDDDLDVTRLLEAHLTNEGHTVTVTHDGKEGVMALMKTTPDLIMLDVFLPDLTGYQMCNKIRKNEATRTTPIIMMTGAARFPNQQMYGRQRGANEYILKPFNIVEVGELVQKYLTPGTAPKKEGDNLVALNTFLKQTLVQPEEDKPEKTGTESGETSMGPIPHIPDPVEPLASFGRIVIETSKPSNGNGHHLDPLPPPPVPSVPFPSVPSVPAAPPVAPIAAASAPVEGYVPQSLGSIERFVEFDLDIFALATRLCSTHAEKYLAEQLLRTSLSMGAEIHLSQTATSPKEFASHIVTALHNLREAGYWLMLIRKAGLEKLGKADLEKTCQSLTTVLSDYEKKR